MIPIIFDVVGHGSNEGIPVAFGSPHVMYEAQLHLFLMFYSKLSISINIKTYI